MATQDVPILAFNRGLVSRLALARTDLKRTGLSAEVYTNYMPRVLGSMMMRPGMGFLGDTANDSVARFLDFVFSATDTALIELTNQNMRVWVNDALIVRGAVATTVVNGLFAVDLSNWAQIDEAGTLSSWIAPGDMQLQGNDVNSAIREQLVVVNAPDQNKEHALRIVIARGLVTLKVGSGTGLDDYVATVDLDAGTHSIAFTPGAVFYVSFRSRDSRRKHVSSIVVEGPGILNLPTPWFAADLGAIKKDQSGDFLFLAAGGAGGVAGGGKGYRQMVIARLAAGGRSWSIMPYSPYDGPFRTVNISSVTLTPSGLIGNCSLTASRALFKSSQGPSGVGDSGALFRLTSIGQTTFTLLNAANVFSQSIKVTGSGNTPGVPQLVNPNIPRGTYGGQTLPLRIFPDPASGPRTFIVQLSGTWSAIVTLQQSTDNVTWTDYFQFAPNLQIPASGMAFNDGLDNQIIYYRIGIKPGDYTSGVVNSTLQFANGSRTGVVRVTAYLSPTQVQAEILSPLGATTPTTLWAEGEWSYFRGFPSSVGFHQGRLWWAGRGKQWGSISDGFYSFDDTFLGDAGPISRSIGSGPVDNINWILSAQRLLFGGDLAEWQVITSSLDEPITPLNFSLRSPASHGSASIQAIKVDGSVIYVRRAGTRVLQLAIDPYIGDYAPTDLTAIVPELFDSRTAPITDISIQRMAVQRLPDARVHCVRADGQVGILVFDKVENVTCWVQLATPGAGGVVEDVVVLPSTPEDAVYYVVRRTINGAVKRFLERWALEAEGRGNNITKLADAFVIYNGAPATVIPAAHLVGQTVCVWADGKDVGTKADGTQTYVVDGLGNVTLAAPASIVIIGLPYTAQWQSAKLAYAAELGTALTETKKVPLLGVILADTHAQGLQYGKDFTSLDPLPLVEDLIPVDSNFIWNEYDKPAIQFDGSWDTDARVCLQSQSPRPCTLLALVATVETHERT